MDIYKTYIQQTAYDGTSYTKGNVVDILDTYHIGCVEFPFERFPKAKKIPERDWHDEDGKDVFIPPTGIILDDYDLEVEFCYKGTLDNIGADMTNFLNFLRGRNSGATGSRLVVYDEHVGFGVKDVVVDEIDPQMYKADGSDPDAIFDFKVKFHVYDPATVVTPVKTAGGKVNDLSFTIKG